MFVWTIERETIDEINKGMSKTTDLFFIILKLSFDFTADH